MEKENLSVPFTPINVPNSVAMLSVSDPIPLVTGTMPSVATDKTPEELHVPSAVAGDAVATSNDKASHNHVSSPFLGQQ